jgi:carbon monoxide dehydrogenase subunit G
MPTVRPSFVALAAWLACATPAYPGDVPHPAVRIRLRHDGTAALIDARAMLHADVATAWRVLSDYDRYAAFVPGVQSSRVVSRDDGRIEVEQSGNASLGAMHERFDVTYEIVEQPPFGLRSRVVRGCDCTLESSYAVSAAGAGVELAYHGRLATRPSVAASVEQMLVERSIAGHFRALAEEIERQAAAR